MQASVPIYKHGHETYHADRCRPLSEAADRGEIRLETLVHGHYPGRRLPRHSLPGIKTIGYWDALHDQDWALDWHRNEGIEITFLESGSLGFSVDGESVTLKPDDITVTRPWQRHRVGLPAVKASRLHWIILDLGVRRPDQPWKWPSWLVLGNSDLEELTNLLRHNEQPAWRATPELRQCFQSIARTVADENDASAASRLTVRINDLFLLLLDMFRQESVDLDTSLSSTRRTVELFLNDLRTHRDHLAIPWTVHEMARSCGLGVTQFIQYTRQVTNMTPVRYLNHCRVESAAQLLVQQPSLSVIDVALSCGFSSSQYFATAFTRRYGQPPRSYRAKAAS